MMIWVFLFSRIVFGQDLTVQEYCFDSNDRLREVAIRMKIVLVPADRVSLIQNCINIQCSSHRSELIEKYLSSFAPDAKRSFSSSAALKDHCEIEIEKIIHQKASSQSTVVNQNNVNFEAGNKTNQRTETSQIKTVNNFEFTYDSRQIKGKCRFISSDHYELELEVSNIQLAPVVIYGSTNLLPTQGPSSNLQTKVSVQIRRGQKLEVGEVLKTSKDEDNSIDMSQGLELKNREEVKSETIYLSIK